MTTVKLIWKTTHYHHQAGKWCEENIGQHGQGWSGGWDKFYNPIFRFDKEEHATMFALRWL